MWVGSCRTHLLLVQQNEDDDDRAKSITKRTRRRARTAMTITDIRTTMRMIQSPIKSDDNNNNQRSHQPRRSTDANPFAPWLV